MTRQPDPAGPLHRRFDASAARDAGTGFTLEASPAERDALAASCDLPGVDALSAQFTVRRDGAGGLRVTGRVAARYRQTCVVTLDTFPAEMDESVDLRFLPEAEVDALAAARAARAGADDEAEDDLPDPIVNGRVDLGEVAAEAFVLGLDPYPRKPGAAFAEPAPPAAAPEASPFAALRQLRGRDGA